MRLGTAANGAAHHPGNGQFAGHNSPVGRGNRHTGSRGGIGWALGVLLGWLIKVILVRLGGSRLYRVARPFFLGLIVGETFAAICWALLPPVLAALGMPYRVVEIVPM